MPGILLDTHALYWLVSGEADLSTGALAAIGENQAAGTLFVSPITAWELAIATQKTRIVGRPHLGDDTQARWFRAAITAADAKVIPITQRIASEAAAVVAATNHRDPGDCFLIATARIRGLAFVTRDDVIRRTATASSDYLKIIRC